MHELTVRVQSKTAEALDIFTFELVDSEGKSLPAFSAGSHIDVHLPNGLTRQYSLCNDSTESHRYQIGVLRDPASRGGSSTMHDAISEGDLLRISAPRNHFPLTPGKRSILVAGGIGVTPILCMAERLSTAGERFEMHYCTRSLERTAFYERIRSSDFRDNVEFHFDDGDPMQKLDLEAVRAKLDSDVHLYVCGPKGFMDWVLGTLRANGWPEPQLHYEFFGAEVAKHDDDGSFEVELVSSGRVIVVDKDKTVVQALAEAGVNVQVSCEQGVCGTCITRVLKGEPDHRDMFLTPQEQAANDQFTPCCSRAKCGRLVLDL